MLYSKMCELGRHRRSAGLASRRSADVDAPAAECSGLLTCSLSASKSIAEPED